MTDANEQRLAALERRIAELEEFRRAVKDVDIPSFLRQFLVIATELKNKLKVHADFIKDAYKGLMGQEKRLDIHSEMIKNIDAEISKLTDGYYKVFPEREVQDSRVTEQLLKLKILEDPDFKD